MHTTRNMSSFAVIRRLNSNNMTVAEIQKGATGMTEPKLYLSGDSAVTVELGDRIDPEINARVHTLMERLGQSELRGIREQIPSFASLLILYDPLVLDYDTLAGEIMRLAALPAAKQAGKRRIHLVPCCYGSHFGPDLPCVERSSGLSCDEIISLHSSTDYRIYMLGFLPGFVYLGGMDERLVTPRLKSPRVRIPAGSVGIGGSQTGIYPLDSPGGWNLIGCTPLNMYDPAREKPVFCAAGEYIRFCPISACDYFDIRQMIQKGTYRHEIITAERE